MIDKTKWPRGPWDDEPDLFFEINAYQTATLIKRTKYGHLCGYVGVLASHAAFGKDYDELPYTVHGGITFTDSWPEFPGYWFIGFDCSHSGDYLPGVMEDYNRGTYRDFPYVKAECYELAAQIGRHKSRGFTRELFSQALIELSYLGKEDWKKLAKELEDAFPLDPAVNSISNAIANELNEESY